ncbi:dna-directed rna polymerase subunit beta/epua [Trichococcus palustris]|uniref:Dna-directed rna polymerase subunit beta/epua n=1 Tax=Trichococcus palustris TaxID=140314 RepID=A0A143Y6Y2_9LACT|nr:DNA-directed RNA polymerase subunit beta [Trichococcus palustris]CZQ81508.1 dna-directed rna polymerase subunit beta/epua [Trichococcus palustris]SFK62398.1 DNA-directed RNA polymerase subunit beta [Trichococcus palustris]
MKFDFKPVVSTLMRVLIFLLLASILFSAGLMVGYGVLGDGNPKLVFEKQTWEHILNFIR